MPIGPWKQSQGLGQGSHTIAVWILVTYNSHQINFTSPNQKMFCLKYQVVGVTSVNRMNVGLSASGTIKNFTNMLILIVV